MREAKEKRKKERKKKRGKLRVRFKILFCIIQMNRQGEFSLRNIQNSDIVSKEVLPTKNQPPSSPLYKYWCQVFFSPGQAAMNIHGRAIASEDILVEPQMGWSLKIGEQLHPL